MFQNDLLDLAIGLVFVWFVLSLVISVINEGLVLLFRIRAKHLWLAIGRLVNPTEGKYARRLWDTLVRLPLSFRVFDLRPRAVTDSADAAATRLTLLKSVDEKLSTKENPTVTVSQRQRKALQRIYDALAPRVTDVALAGRKSKLTKISGAVFAEAIANLTRSVHWSDLEQAAETSWNPEQRAALIAAREAAGESPEDVIDVGAFMALEILSRAPGGSTAAAGEPITKAAELPIVTETEKRLLFEQASTPLTPQDIIEFFKGNPDLARALSEVPGVKEATAKVADLCATVETWFNREMDQLSAMYRRQSRKILAILALPVVLIFQANTLAIVSDLRSDSALRDAVVNQAVAVAANSSIADVLAKDCPPDDAAAPSSTTAGASATTATGAADNTAEPTQSPVVTGPVSTPTDTSTASSAGESGAASTTGPTASSTAPSTTTSGNTFTDATEKLKCAGKVIEAAGSLSLVPDIDRLQKLDPAHDSFFFGLSWGDIWGYESEEWGLFGRAMTALALMFGAQFWFDVLRRLVGIRKFVGGKDESVAG